MHLDGRVAPFVLVTTFFHELIHLLDFELSDGEMTEAQVKALAVGLASVFGGVVNQLLGVRQTEEGTDESR